MTLQLTDITLELRDRLAVIGVPLPFALKRRDPREPGRRRKERTEDELHSLFLAYFRKQKYNVRKTLSAVAPHRKTLFGYDVDYYMMYLEEHIAADNAFIAKLGRVLTKAATNGVLVFKEMIDLEMDYTLVNQRAVRWANKYAGNLISGIDKTTKQAVRQLMGDFVRTPGMTIGDIVNNLPYNESRSLMIATTETTKTYAMANRMAGEALAKEYPDVLVVKRWFTNNDDIVCDICRPLNGTVVPLNEKWPGGIDQPPAHVNCRCWMTTSTRIGG